VSFASTSSILLQIYFISLYLLSFTKSFNFSQFSFALVSICRFGSGIWYLTVFLFFFLFHVDFSFIWVFWHSHTCWPHERPARDLMDCTPCVIFYINSFFRGLVASVSWHGQCTETDTAVTLSVKSQYSELPPSDCKLMSIKANWSVCLPACPEGTHCVVWHSANTYGSTIIR